jgi:hypothetical protein
MHSTWSSQAPFVRGQGCSGTIVQGATTGKLIWPGQTVYAHTARMPTNEWMRAASSVADIQGLIDLRKPGSLLAPLTASGLSNAARSVTPYDGQSALAFTWPDPVNGQPWSIVVTDARTTVLPNISQRGYGNRTFTGYRSTTTIAPPAAG